MIDTEELALEYIAGERPLHLDALFNSPINSGTYPVLLEVSDTSNIRRLSDNSTSGYTLFAVNPHPIYKEAYGILQPNGNHVRQESRFDFVNSYLLQHISLNKPFVGTVTLGKEGITEIAAKTSEGNVLLYKD